MTIKSIMTATANQRLLYGAEVIPYEILPKTKTIKEKLEV